MKKFLAFPLILLLLALSACAPADGAPRDGQYTVEVTLSGGSGRASIASPAEMTVADGAMTARIIWSSPHYDFMLVDGTYYYPVNTEGNSTFEIPVSCLDEEVNISAETTAMSEPHVIDYTLRFDSSTLKEAGGNATGVILAIAAALILAAIVFAVILPKRKLKRRSADEA
ncbi:MAG: hypothetical protein AAGU74_00570 [Bacillota bacterium]